MRWIVSGFIIVGMLVTPVLSPAEPEGKSIKFPEALKSALDYCLSLPDSETTVEPDFQQIEKIIAFIDASKDSYEMYTSERHGIPASYVRFELQADLRKVLEYTYNENIPPHLLAPSSVRLAYWSNINGKKQPFPNLWEYLPKLEQPIMIKCVEHTETTPDVFSGAYYAYDIDRTVILCRHQNRNVLISISKQKDKSDVGKKGFVIGSDKDWNYLYSNEKGLTKAGLGWVDSYMYDSFSVNIQYEKDSEPGKVICGVFSWVKAGWAGINMVKPKHIHNGLKRYAAGFKQVIESPRLPPSDELASASSKLKRLSSDELKQKVQAYLSKLEKRCSDSESFKDACYAMVNGSNYFNQMKPEQLYAILTLEYLKGVINGK